MYGALNVTVLRDVQNMERDSSLAIMDGVNTNLRSQADSFLRGNRDWSSWDETYNFVNGENPGYVESELTTSTLDNLGVQLFTVLGSSGEVFYHQSTESSEWTNEVLNQITSGGRFVPDGFDWNKAGYASVDGKNILLVANPILTSNDEGPVKGSLIWVEVVDNAALTSLIPISGTKVAINVKEDQSGQVPKGTSLTALSSSELLGEMRVEPSIDGMDDILIDVTFPRQYYQTALASIYMLSGFAVLIGVVAIITFRYSVVTLIKDFGEIGSTISKLDPSKSLDHIKYSKKNELHVIVEGFNRLLDEVESNKVKLAENERLVSMGQTATMVGHDLRNPLQVITLTSFLTRKKISEEELSQESMSKLTSYLDTLDEQTVYMDKIVGDIQSYTSELKPVLIDVDIIETAKETLSTIKVPNNIEVRVEINPSLPRMMIDPLLMKRVFFNLILNAIQAIPDEGVIRIYADVSGGSVVVSIQDSGLGMSPEVLEKIFVPFYTTKSKGTGLGLAAAMRIVNAHGGTISVESKVGEGSRFHIVLPVKRASSVVNEPVVSDLYGR
jgi:signal transduction histidine kinase